MSRLYIISEGKHFHKIGRSSNPMARLRALQSGSPRALTLTFMSGLVSHEAAVGHERTAHKILEQFRISGEWFDLPFDLVKKWTLSAIRMWDENLDDCRSGSDYVLPALAYHFVDFEEIRPDYGAT